MSALWAPVPDGPEPELAPEPSPPALRAIPAGLPRLARVPFLLVLVGIFGLGMTGLLMLNTTLQNQAFEASTLNRQATELAYTQAGLESQLDRQAAPQVLAQRASAYGLRDNPYPAFLVLPSGRVVGKPRRVVGDELPSTIVKTPAQLSAERAAAAVRRQQRAVAAAAKARAASLAAAQAAVRRAAAARRPPATTRPPATPQTETPQTETQQTETPQRAGRQQAAQRTARKAPVARTGATTGGRG